MDRIMWTSRTAMNAQQEKLDMISNNIANMDTDGYKSGEVGFSDLVYDNLKRLGVPVTDDPNRAVAPQNGTGIRATEMIRDNTQGNLIQTNQSTNLALDGEGYYKVIRPDGSNAYERSGDFILDGLGRLTDNNGNRLEVIGQQNYTNGQFKVDKDGTINVNGTNVGKINVYDAIGQNSLTSIGNNLYLPKSGVQMFATNGASIMQGYSEGSNVDISKEMSDMIIAQRAFELSSKGLSTADEMASMVNELGPK